MAVFVIYIVIIIITVTIIMIVFIIVIIIVIIISGKQLVKPLIEGIQKNKIIANAKVQ